MNNISQFPEEDLKKIDFLLTDIDDTITTEGQLPAQSLLAMERLAEVGVKVIPITGRPAGWCDHIARMWPVAAVVGENGAFYFSYDLHQATMLQVYADNAAQRKKNRERLEQIKKEILATIPGAGVASDQEYRIADLAIDFCEDVAPLSEKDIQVILGIFKQHGATAKRSSIHINGWYGTYDKLSMTRTCMNDLFGVDIDTENTRVAYTGDSPNDAPMFCHFIHSVGVANVADYTMDHLPQWITSSRSAMGFCEFAGKILAAKTL
ncbi:MAG: HAD family hydrolase [Deltaproteobacteria bacterium]|nr:MAG: HAD family hydrolase [Deltaproteobacteria bacterium]